MKSISKSRFISYLSCPKNAWYQLHQPELKEFQISDNQQVIFDQGYKVEDYAKELFPNYKEVDQEKSFIEQVRESEMFVKNKIKVIYQPTFIADGFNFWHHNIITYVPWHKSIIASKCAI